MVRVPAFARRLRLAVLAVGLLAAPPVLAQSGLETAKAAGLVGERPDGLVGIVAEAPAEVEALVKQINTRRLSQYQEIARRTGTELPAVQAVAGEKAIEQASPGSFVMDAAGTWRRK